MSDLSTRHATPLGRQERAYPARYEIRGLAGSKVEVLGCASTFNKPYEMFDSFGSYNETVRSGAFTKTLSNGADVAFLANHTGLTLARTPRRDASGTGTLRLDEDLNEGLLATATLNTARGDARDLLTAIEDGDIDQMSFGFRVVLQQWSPEYDERSLVELNLDRGDVSAVNFGANPTTSIGVQRAFRHARPAALHRMADELRAGKMLSAATAATLSQVLDLIAAADDAVDAAQPLLAQLLGVPNPDDDGEAPEADAGARALSVYALRQQHRHERDSLAT